MNQDVLSSLKAKMDAGVRLVSLEEAAAFLGIGTQTLRNRLSRSAKDPICVKSKLIGRRRLFDIQELHRFVNDLPNL